MLTPLIFNSFQGENHDKVFSFRRVLSFVMCFCYTQFFRLCRVYAFNDDENKFQQFCFRTNIFFHEETEWENFLD